MKASKIVLVTGASSGIGQEISKALCKEGYEVILTSRTKKKLIKLNKELENLGYTSHPIPCDVSNEIEVKNLYKKSLEIGFVSCVVNNAGFGKFSKIEKTSEVVITTANIVAEKKDIFFFMKYIGCIRYLIDISSKVYPAFSMVDRLVDVGKNCSSVQNIFISNNLINLLIIWQANGFPLSR